MSTPPLPVVQALEPCPNPWCNAVNPPLCTHLKREGWRVICDCGVHTPRFPTAADACTAWNTRPSQAPLLAQLEEMREALEDFRLAAEYWAGCDEGCDAETASDEIMRSGGAWPAQAYDKAMALLAKIGAAK